MVKTQTKTEPSFDSLNARHTSDGFAFQSEMMFLSRLMIHDSYQSDEMIITNTV